MKVLVFGGSFNPVHIGHLIMADEVREEFGYDTVLMIPTAKAPHKAAMYGVEDRHRLEMLRLSVAADHNLAVDDCEMLRGGISYTVDTLAYMYKRYSFDGKPGLLLGDDLIPDFSSWYQPQAIADSADILCAHRSSPAEMEFPFAHRYAHNTMIGISSSMIRSRIASGQSFRHLVVPLVYDYIEEHRLYGLS